MLLIEHDDDDEIIVRIVSCSLDLNTMTSSLALFLVTGTCNTIVFQLGARNNLPAAAETLFISSEGHDMDIPIAATVARPAPQAQTGYSLKPAPTCMW